MATQAPRDGLQEVDIACQRQRIGVPSGDLRKGCVMRLDEGSIMFDQRWRWKDDAHAQIAGCRRDLQIAHLHKTRDDQVYLPCAGDAEEVHRPFQPADGGKAFRIVFPIAAHMAITTA